MNQDLKFGGLSFWRVRVEGSTKSIQIQTCNVKQNKTRKTKDV